MAEVREKIAKLQEDLNKAMDVSNRCIADRLRLHEEKQVLLQQLRDGMRTVSRLESQLKVLSASTLSMSSSSSLGSLSSSHASSKGRMGSSVGFLADLKSDLCQIFTKLTELRTNLT